ncbi:protein lethal(2)essential for life-like [Orussus abietinus]|uniref:protein lethal(2)essential for life-like n=1 Tax=Orussus abietinus TaxID=222816 RepID=UPI000626940C|nr:protein lethal(2)essential for life-like [Orussus abietinus]XP_012277091.1 protein lethal(2)essential for life-like [Orussus abietinus]
MAVVPLMFRDWWDDLDRSRLRLLDRHFDGILTRDDPLLSELSNLSLTKPRSLFGAPGYFRPWRTIFPTSGASTIKSDKDTFQVILDVQQFSPEEITVKTVGENVIVEAKHEEKRDEHGFISRHFVRRYVLPSSHNVENVTSSLSSDGVLTITAPKKAPESNETERIVNIVRTGVPAPKSDEEKVNVQEITVEHQ